MHYSKIATNSPLLKLSARWEVAYRSVSRSKFWFLLLTALGSLSNVVYTCTVPLVGFGVIAGATLPRRRAIATMMTMWFVNQLLGFTIHNYPQTLNTFTWGLVLGLGTLLVTLLASIKPSFGSSPMGSHYLWLAVALMGGYVLYECVILLAGFALGGVEGFTLPILWGVFAGNAVWAITLGCLHSILLWDTSRQSSHAVLKH
ncbi:MAG: hypothetical protein F6K16_17980 [Symploca sp. SIO2B6]|nr:hypothetical protein [Symploca sp. SIO2B6]